jgi:hypothetical protein
VAYLTVLVTALASQKKQGKTTLRRYWNTIESGKQSFFSKGYSQNNTFLRIWMSYIIIVCNGAKPHYGLQWFRKSDDVFSSWEYWDQRQSIMHSAKKMGADLPAPKSVRSCSNPNEMSLNLLLQILQHLHPHVAIGNIRNVQSNFLSIRR